MAVIGTGNPQASSYPAQKTNLGAMSMVTTLFFMWGFCTVLNDILIPHLQGIFSLTYLQSSMIQLAFFSSYFIFAQPAGKLVEWIGYKQSMIVGLITMGVGALLFIPAASFVAYPLFLGAQVVLAAGVTVLQVAANPYVTILGPPELASSRLNLTQAFNTLGDTVAPYFGSILILGGAATALKHAAAERGATAVLTQSEQAASVKLPYMVVAGILLLLAVAIALYRFPRLEVTQDFRPGGMDGKQDSIWNHPHVYLGAIAIFIYVGAEVSIGSYLAKYLADPHIAGLTLEEGAKLVSFYWGGMMVGRFVGSALMAKMSAPNLLAISGVGAAVLVLCSLLGTGGFAEWTILAVGLFNSIMFPTIFTLAVAELGPLTGRGAGLLVQGIVGGAVIPVMMGWCADHFGIHHSLALPLICYGFIVYYGLRGYRIKPQELQSHLEPVPGT